MAHGSEHSAGVMIVKNHFAGSVLQSYIDPKGHFLMLVICINNITFIQNYINLIIQDSDSLFFQSLKEVKSISKNEQLA